MSKRFDNIVYEFTIPDLMRYYGLRDDYTEKELAEILKIAMTDEVWDIIDSIDYYISDDDTVKVVYYSVEDNIDEAVDGIATKDFLKKAQKKHKKTIKKGALGAFEYLCGDPKRNAEIFNHMMGTDAPESNSSADGVDTSVGSASTATTTSTTV